MQVDHRRVELRGGDYHDWSEVDDTRPVVVERGAALVWLPVDPNRSRHGINPPWELAQILATSWDARKAVRREWCWFATAQRRTTNDGSRQRPRGPTRRERRPPGDACADS